MVFCTMVELLASRQSEETVRNWTCDCPLLEDAARRVCLGLLGGLVLRCCRNVLEKYIGSMVLLDDHTKQAVSDLKRCAVQIYSCTCTRASTNRPQLVKWCSQQRCTMQRWRSLMSQAVSPTPASNTYASSFPILQIIPLFRVVYMGDGGCGGLALVVSPQRGLGDKTSSTKCLVHYRLQHAQFSEWLDVCWAATTGASLLLLQGTTTPHRLTGYSRGAFWGKRALSAEESDM